MISGPIIGKFANMLVYAFFKKKKGPNCFGITQLHSNKTKETKEKHGRLATGRSGGQSPHEILLCSTKKHKKIL